MESNLFLLADTLEKRDEPSEVLRSVTCFDLKSNVVRREVNLLEQANGAFEGVFIVHREIVHREQYNDRE